MERDAVGALVKLNTKPAEKNLENLTKGAENAEKQLKKTGQEAENLASKLKKAFSPTAIIGWIATLGQSIKTMMKATEAESEYIESMNLLQVSYNQNAESAEKLIYTMNQLLGLDPAGLTRQLGIYRQFSSAMGIAGEKANLLSENLLKLQADVSSLYNLDFATAGKKLQSAMAGQTRPVRELGADITEASLQQELYNRGINKSVSELSRASKSVLIYLTLERQLKNANQDAGATINQLAQQMKIFKEQTAMAGRQIGAVFIPILKAILPYANAILMVFNEIMNMLLKLLGVDVSKMAKEGIANRTLVNDFDDLSGSIDKTANSAKKAKNQLRGFDKLNNITTPQNGSSGVGGIGGGGIGGVDSALLDALKEYDLGDIQNKASKIRDSIMEWAGFARDANGEWKFSKITLGTVVTGLVAGGGLIWGLSKIWGLFKKIKGVGSGITSLLGLGKSTTALKEASGLSKATKSFTLPSFSTVLKGLGELALIIGALGALIIAIGELTKIPGFNDVLTRGLKAVKELFTGLGSVFLPITAFCALVVGLGYTSTVVVPGILSLAGIIGGLEVLIGAIGLLASIPEVSYVVGQGLSLTIQVFEGLHKVIKPLGEFSLLIVGLGITSGAVLPGILAFASIVGGLEVLMGAIGLLSAVPYVKEFVESGADIMILMAEKLGNMAGALVKGLVGKATEAIPEVGSNLTKFMENSKGFFNGLKEIPDNGIQSVKTLTEAMLLLTASSFLDGIMRFVENFSIIGLFIGKRQTLADFGDTLIEFAPKLIKFNTAIAPLSEDDVKKTDLVAGIVKKWVDLAKDIKRSGGSLITLIAGDNSLSAFGGHLEAFSYQIVNYTREISLLNSTGVKNNDNVLDITKKWIDLSKSIGRSGTSLVSLIAGDDGLGAFGVQLRNYGASLKTYSNSVSDIKLDKIEATIKTTDLIIDVAQRIKNNKLASDDYLEDFGEDLEEIGENIEDYYDYIKNINVTKMNQVTDALNMVVYSAKMIKEYGVKGYLKEFSKELSPTATGLNSLFSVKSGETLGKNFGNAIAKKIASAIKGYSYPTISITGQGGTLSTYKMKAYKEGGFVDSGEIFLSRENGIPEFVGSIGSRTAVANNDQIVEGITMGVARGMSQVKPQQIVIKADADTSGLLNFINFEQEQRNRQYGL